MTVLNGTRISKKWFPSAGIHPMINSQLLKVLAVLRSNWPKKTSLSICAIFFKDSQSWPHTLTSHARLRMLFARRRTHVTTNCTCASGMLEAGGQGGRMPPPRFWQIRRRRRAARRISTCPSSFSDLATCLCMCHTPLQPTLP